MSSSSPSQWSLSLPIGVRYRHFIDEELGYQDRLQRDHPEMHLEYLEELAGDVNQAHASGRDDYERVSIDLGEDFNVEANLAASMSKRQKQNMRRAYGNRAGARKLRNKAGGDRKYCLMNSILAHIDEGRRENIKADIMEKFDGRRDVSIADLIPILANHQIWLERMNEKYIRKGGAPYHILQSRNSKLIIHVKLTTCPKRKVLHHFVAWDGTHIIDNPHNCWVNKTTDRIDSHSCKAAFGKIFPKNEFLAWQIIGVFELKFGPPPSWFLKCGGNS